MKKSDKIKYIDPVTDRDLVDSIVHNRPRQDLLNNWIELRQILSRITRATGTSPHISQVPFWGDRFAIGSRDNFVAAASRLDSSLYNLYGMATALLAASSDNITYADAVVESKLRISRKILVASTTHLVDNQVFSRWGIISGNKRVIPYYLSTFNANKTSFRVGEAPIYCYTCFGGNYRFNFFQTQTDLDSWYEEDFYPATSIPSWNDWAIFPIRAADNLPWYWVSLRGSADKEGGAALITPWGWDWHGLDEDENKGKDGRPHSFVFPTPDFWSLNWYHNCFHRYELRYKDYHYCRVLHCGVGYQRKPYLKDPTQNGDYIPFFIGGWYKGKQYFLQLTPEYVKGKGPLFVVFLQSGGYFGINIYCAHWRDGKWTRRIVGWLKIPSGELTPRTDMVVTISITTIPGESNTYLVLLSAFHDDWSRNYWKKIKINHYWDRSYNAEWDGSFFELIYDEKGNVFDRKLSVASNVPMIDGKKLVVDFGAGPGEDIKGIWVRELEFRTI